MQHKHHELSLPPLEFTIATESSRQMRIIKILLQKNIKKQLVKMNIKGGVGA
jgi:hypothetical protein